MNPGLRRSPFLQALGLIAAFLLAACLLCGAFYGIVQLRHHMQARFAEMHDLLSEQPMEAQNAAEMERRDGAAPELASALAWDTLSAARMEFAGEAATPRYTPQLLTLDGTEQSVTGYMFPLSESGGVPHFLLSPYPSSCPFCLPAGPSELIEVTAKEPIAFTYEPVTLQGRFILLRKADDISQGMFYRMTDAILRKH